MVMLSVCSLSCSDKSDVPLSRLEQSAANQTILREFEAIAERLEQSTNPYFGRRRLKVLEAGLKLDGQPDAKQVNRWLELCFHELRLGNVQEARAAIGSAFEIVHSIDTPRLTSAALKVRAMVSLREAETSNCILNHNRECCIFPLAAGGIHQIAAPARNAKVDILSCLEREPSDLMLQWLLNVACMALNEYPQGVPERFRIPEQYFKPAISSPIAPFTDIAPQLGIDTLNLAGGVIVEDFDGNGFLDIVTSTSDPRECIRFFRNLGNGEFEDSTPGSGLDVQLGGLNCIGADYDNDGDTDVLVLRGAWLEDHGQIRNSLLRNNGVNEDGRITFTDVTRQAGLADHAFPTQTAAWGDFDNDGDLDLFVGNESRMEVKKGTGDYPCQLFENDGHGVFTDIAREAGVTNDRFCKGAAAGDYDNDGDLDIYVSNVGLNRLYRNDGAMRFTDVAPELGVQGFAGYNFAPWFFDLNNDGYLDLFVGAYMAALEDFMADSRGLPNKAVPPNLYLNNRDGTFTDIADKAGLSHPYLPMGANFGDVDNDGYLDIYLATGESRFEVLTPNVLLRNVRGERFENATYAARLGHLQKGHGVAFADFDHDGDQDLFNQLGGFFPGDRFHNALFLNPGTENNHHLVIKCIGTPSNRDAIGARIAVSVVDSDGTAREMHRAVGAVSSFGGSPLHQEIGLGKANKIQSVIVRWPNSRTTQTFTEVPLDVMVEITEGESELRILNRQVLQF